MENVVMVPVPLNRLTEVYRLLGSPSAAGVLAVDTEADAWTEEMVARAYRESAERMRKVFDTLMADPDRRFSASELAKILGISQSQIRGVLGAFGNRVKSRYKLATWPIDSRYSETESTSYFWMTSDQARSFKQARKNA
jgi:hypothetical protein